ncbi:MAG: MCE family protein [Bergeyella sp.]|nr:MCE family protein [Bergeyella sp.]
MKVSKELKAGIIAILALVGFVTMFQFIKGKSIFSSTNTYYAKFENVEGLEPSSPVSINGLKVGQVDKIIPVSEKNGTLGFVVKVVINKKFSFSKQSSLEVFEPSLMSSAQLRLNMAYGKPIAKNKDTLPTQRNLSFLRNVSSQVEPVKNQLQSVLRGVDTLANSANKLFDAENRREIKSLLENLNKMAVAFEKTAQQTRLLVEKNDAKVQKLLDNTNAVTLSAKGTLDKYKKVAEQVNISKLNSTINNLDQMTLQLNSMIKEMNKGEGNIGKLLKDEKLYANLLETSKNLNELVVDLKKNPKRYVSFSLFGKK